MIQQSGGAVPQSPLELILVSSPETKIVLLVTALFSLVSWFIIILKWWQFRKLNRFEMGSIPFRVRWHNCSLSGKKR